MNETGLAKHFKTNDLLKYTMPSMFMMVVYSTYILFDGLFISNFVGSTAYAAVNVVGNYILIFPAIGTMLGSGGASLISKTLGENDRDKASDIFSMVVGLSIIVGCILTVVCFFTIEWSARLQGASGELLENCLQYGRIASFFIMFYIVQSEFQYFFSVVEKEGLGFMSAIISGVINIALDALFIIVFKWGLMGAAIASLCGVVFGGCFPILYFKFNKKLSVGLRKMIFKGKYILQTMANGSSEMIINLSLAIVGILFNYQLMKYSGENGVAAYGVIQAITLIFMGVFQGYSIGVIPIIGYHFGAKNKKEIRSLLFKSLKIVMIIGVILFLILELSVNGIVNIFVGYDRKLAELAANGLRIYSTVMLFAGISVFASGFFTALNDGFNSALISFMRTMVFLVVLVLILPIFWGVNGIWISTTVAEILAVIVSVIILVYHRDRY